MANELIEAGDYPATQLEQMTYAQVLKTMTKAEMELFEEIEELHSSWRNNDLMGSWEMGRKLCEVSKHENKYGTSFLLKTALALGLASAKPLTQLMRIASAWPTKGEFLKNVVNRCGEGYNIGVTQLDIVAGISNEKMREDVLRLTFEKQWTIDDLREYAQKKKLLEKPRGMTGRPLGTPKSVVDCLSKMRAAAKEITNKATNVWMGEQWHLTTEFMRTPPDKIDDDFVAEVDNTHEQLVALQLHVQTLVNAVAHLKEQSDLRRAANSNETVEGTVVDEPQTEDVEDSEDIADADADDSGPTVIAGSQSLAEFAKANKPGSGKVVRPGKKSAKKAAKRTAKKASR